MGRDIGLLMYHSMAVLTVSDGRKEDMFESNRRRFDYWANMYVCLPMLPKSLWKLLCPKRIAVGVKFQPKMRKRRP